MVRVTSLSSLFTVLLCGGSGAAEVNPPDMSLSTLPVVYYGANWNRSQQNIDVLARFQIVILMQEDGHCWATCCPDRFAGGSQCGPLHNATAIPGCNSSCAQHASQAAVFARMKESALRQKRRPGHAILYMNSVYLWPFDVASEQGKEVQLLDVHGEPHMESCDPGIFPSYFWSFDREAAQHAWLDIISEHVVNGPADGVYDDCDSTIPLRCPDPETSNNTCVAKRNGKMASVNEQVTRAQMEAYTSGKNRTMLQAAKLVGVNGTFFNKNAGKPTERGPSFGGGNLQFMWPGGSRQDPGDPGKFAEDVAAALQHYTYLIIGGSNSFSNPKMESLPTGQNLADGRSLRTCDSDLVARFLLAVEPGVFLLCNGWDPRFDRKLGLPLGKAKLDSSTQVWSRSFSEGVKATWDSQTKLGTVHWPGFAPTPPGPPSPHPLPPAPPWTGPACPSTKCPVVPKVNYKGCFHDRTKGHDCDLPCRPPGASGGCTAWSKEQPAACYQNTSDAYLRWHAAPSLGAHSQTDFDQPDSSWPGAPDSVERCNQLCLSTGVAFKYFGMQAGHACFCGMDYGHQGKAPDADCNKPCLGNASQMCGGPFLNSVWATQPI